MLVLAVRARRELKLVKECTCCAVRKNISWLIANQINGCGQKNTPNVLFKRYLDVLSLMIDNHGWDEILSGYSMGYQTQNGFISRVRNTEIERKFF